MNETENPAFFSSATVKFQSLFSASAITIDCRGTREGATAKLIVSIGQKECAFLVEPGVPCRIGRSPHNTVELPNESVSRAHAMVQFTDGGSCYLYDLDSRNGTSVNGRRVSVPTMLRHGDRVTIGPYHLSFEHEESTTVPVAMQPASAASAGPAEHQLISLVISIRDHAATEQRLGTTKMAEITKALHSDAAAILDDLGAAKRKSVGPAILAVWAHPSVKPPLNVVLSAFESVAKVARTASGLQARFGLDSPIRISAAIETGIGSLSELDGDETRDLAALGDAVNRTFRIDSGIRQLDREVAFGPATGEILSQGVALGELAEQRSVTVDGAEPTPLWVMSLESLGRMLVALPQRTVRVTLP